MIDTNALIGIPYQWGARGPDAFDCWGLVLHVCNLLGMPAPPDWHPDTRRDAYRMMASAAGGKDFEQCAPNPWRIVAMGSRTRIFHCGMSVPGGILHAQVAAGVMVSSEFALRTRGFSRIEHYRCTAWDR